VADSDQQQNRLFVRILWGIGAGILTGLVFGDAIQPLSILATAFIRLLQVNVLPYLLGSLIASLGSRGTAEIKLVARYLIALLVLVWGLALVLVLISPLAFPPFAGVPVFDVSDPPAPIDWLDLYIPANPFHALSNNLIPAVVVFGILAGIALGQMAQERKAALLQAMDAFNEAMGRVSKMIVRLSPYGLFTIAAVSAGQMRIDDLLRLQVWLHFYIGATLLFTLWILPSLVSRFTGVPYMRFLRTMSSAIVTAAAAGDAVVVLPLIAESAKELVVEAGSAPDDVDRTISVAIPILINFPHVGKLLTLAFVPFAAWFSGSELGLKRLLLLVTAGPLSLFGNINAAMPFLLNIVRLPADLFSLFTMSSLVNARFGAMVAATHVAALAVLVTSAILGRVRISLARVAQFAAVTIVLVAGFTLSTRAIFSSVLPPAPSGLSTLSAFDLRPPLAAAERVAAVVADANRVRGHRLEEIRARGVLRVGYFDDAMPWAFVNASGHLVGHDIEAGHRLASQLGVRLAFLRVSRTDPYLELDGGRIDVLMTGYRATVARAEKMELSHPYQHEHLGFMVHDYDRGKFESLETMQQGAGFLIAVPPIEGSVEAVKQLMPLAVTRTFASINDVIGDPSITAIYVPLERAYYWSQVHPEFAAVRPAELTAANTLVYAVPDGEVNLRSLIDLWIETRRASGEADEAYDYWVRGRALRPRVARWSVLRNVLGAR